MEKMHLLTFHSSSSSDALSSEAPLSEMFSHSTSSSVPSSAFEMEHFLKARQTSASGMQAQASTIHEQSIAGEARFSRPAGVTSGSPDLIHSTYRRLTWSLNGLLRHTSSGCSCDDDDELGAGVAQQSLYGVGQVTPKRVEHKHRREPQQCSGPSTPHGLYPVKD